MIEALIKLSDQNLDYARRLTADLSDEQAVAQPPGVAGAMNHAVWVVGHLAFVSDVLLGVLGGESKAPAEWKDLFSMVSKPLGGAAYRGMTLAQLMEAWAASRAEVQRRAREKPAEFWRHAIENERRRARFGTNDVLLVHMLVNHDAVHLGQLSAWRRAHGLPSV